MWKESVRHKYYAPSRYCSVSRCWSLVDLQWHIFGAWDCNSSQDHSQGHCALDVLHPNFIHQNSKQHDASCSNKLLTDAQKSQLSHVIYNYNQIHYFNLLVSCCLINLYPFIMSHKKSPYVFFKYSNSPTNSPARFQWQRTEVSLLWAMVTLATQKCKKCVFCMFLCGEWWVVSQWGCICCVVFRWMEMGGWFCWVPSLRSYSFEITMLYPVTVIPIRDLDLNVCDQILRDIGIGEQSNRVECLDGWFGCWPHPSISRSAHMLRNSEWSSMSCGTR